MAKKRQLNADWLRKDSAMLIGSEKTNDIYDPIIMLKVQNR